MDRPGVDFINVQRTAFTLVDPESAKIQFSHQYLFMLLGSTSVKAVSRTLMKLTPGIPSLSSQCLERRNINNPIIVICSNLTPLSQVVLIDIK